MDPENTNSSEHQDDPAKAQEGLKAALEAERGKRQAAEERARGLEQTVAGLEGRIKGLETSREQAKPQQLSEAQLRQAVADERMTEEDAEAYRRQNFRQEIVGEVKKTVADTVAESQRLTDVSGKIARYKVVYPDLTDLASENRAKVKAEFDELVALGDDPNDIGTELKALRAAFGGIEAIEAAGRRKPPETHQETGGQGGGGEGEGGEGWPKDMPADTRRYYQDLVGRGIYTQKSAIEEFRYKPKHRPSRAA